MKEEQIISELSSPFNCWSYLSQIGGYKRPTFVSSIARCNTIWRTTTFLCHHYTINSLQSHPTPTTSLSHRSHHSHHQPTAIWNMNMIFRMLSAILFICMKFAWKAPKKESKDTVSSCKLDGWPGPYIQRQSFQARKAIQEEKQANFRQRVSID